MFFHSKRSDNTKNSSSSMKLDERLKKIRYCIILKDAIAKKFVANEHHSFTFLFTFSVVVVDQATDCFLSFLFPAETDESRFSLFPVNRRRRRELRRGS